MLLVLIGLALKNVADNIFAPYSDDIFAAAGVPSVLASWAAALAFGAQIYCDFAGYSTCAVGAALCLGFVIPHNFRYPYAAVGFSDFWRRWHITLSSWLRDYLYIPLGGNRRGLVRTQINLLVTMFLGGLWHGASWLFAIWGLLHGLFLVIERAGNWFIRYWHAEAIASSRALVAAYGVLTFAGVSLAWIFFRAQSLDRAVAMTGAALGLRDDAPWARLPADQAVVIPLAAVAGLVGFQVYMRNRDFDAMLDRLGAAWQTVLVGSLLFLLLMSSGDDRSFIYFQF
jgi:D-alanyl-lipoteichoic acid acyltransferase DltB (MBOAT superfamily)